MRRADNQFTPRGAEAQRNQRFAWGGMNKCEQIMFLLLRQQEVTLLVLSQFFFYITTSVVLPSGKIYCGPKLMLKKIKGQHWRFLSCSRGEQLDIRANTQATELRWCLDTISNATLIKPFWTCEYNQIGTITNTIFPCGTILVLLNSRWMTKPRKECADG